MSINPHVIGVNTAVEKAGLMPIEDCYYNPPILAKMKEMTYVPKKKDLKKMCKSNGVDINELYFTGNMYSPIVYMPDNYSFLIELTTLHPDFMITGLGKVKQFKNEFIQYINEGDYASILGETSNRFKDFIYQINKDKVSIDKFPAFFKKAYAKQEFNFDIKEDDIEKLRNNKEEKEYIKRKVGHLVNNDGYITIYRGEGSKSTCYSEAWSWTTSIEIAEFFANRFDSDGRVLKSEVKIEDIFAFIHWEAEVLVESEYLNDVKVLSEDEIQELIDGLELCEYCGKTPKNCSCLICEFCDNKSQECTCERCSECNEILEECFCD